MTFMSTGSPDYFNRYSYTANDPINRIDPDGEFWGVASKVVKVAIKGGDVASVLAGAKQDIGTLTSSNASGWQKLGAAASLATEVFSPVSARDAKAGAKFAQKKLSGKCCFVAGTLVETEYGLRPIEEIELGDRVLARNPETGETAFKAVTDLIRLNERMIWEVSLSGENNTSEFFETTDDHPWWIVDADGNGSWKTTAELSAGMIVTTADNQIMIINKIVQTDRIDATYNLTVADFETYFVGENKVLVHNCPTGAYRNDHTQGPYIGKGDEKRAAESARRIEKETGDPLVSTTTHDAPTDRDSFKLESQMLDDAGGPKSSSNYNKIESPGKKYRQEDGDL